MFVNFNYYFVFVSFFCVFVWTTCKKRVVCAIRQKSKICVCSFARKWLNVCDVRTFMKHVTLLLFEKNPCKM